MIGEGPKDQAVAREIARLAEFDRQELVQRWLKAFGRRPPHKLSRALIEKALAHEIQCQAFGGLSASARRALNVAIGSAPTATASRPVSPGARLVREWNGRIYEVEVVEDGFRWQDRSWRSLSAIAREITGTNRSGPRFFGLREPR